MCIMGEHRRRKDDLICSPLGRLVEIASSAAAGVVMICVKIQMMAYKKSKKELAWKRHKRLTQLVFVTLR